MGASPGDQKRTSVAYLRPYAWLVLKIVNLLAHALTTITYMRCRAAIARQSQQINVISKTENQLLHLTGSRWIVHNAFNTSN
jgi:hypothetical protein